MLRIERPLTESQEREETRDGEGDGLLLLGLLAASWVVALGVGWVVWRLAPF
ncbi:MAG: hypothetical protein RIB98_02570 [Acidimicrobiales bacterium]